MMLNNRGLHTIEYALILAFILITGSFLYNESFADAISNPVTKIEALLSGNAKPK